MGVGGNGYTTAEREEGQRKSIGCIPPWLLLALDNMHKLTQSPSFTFSPHQGHF